MWSLMPFTDVLPIIHGAVEWLLTPMSGSMDHSVGAGTAWHGRLMVLAWLILAPLSIIIARFYKVTANQDWPRVLDNPFWFIAHRRIGYLAGVFMLIALGAIYWGNGFEFRWLSFHGTVGWSLLLLGAVQIIGSAFRGTHGGPVHPMTREAIPPERWHGDHYSMTRRRIVFEYLHKSMGYALLPFIGLAISSGLSVVDAPRWMWAATAGLCLVFVGLFVRLQRQGRCIDTYQAIWGGDRTLPGNRREQPIGWGVRRCAQDDERRPD